MLSSEEDGQVSSDLMIGSYQRSNKYKSDLRNVFSDKFNMTDVKLSLEYPVSIKFIEKLR